ncbi:flagellar assembly protein A [Haloimpatiens sp. FM7330]|uniref:flagellar assembly protein A n=1 Tax=Haloimpatiens sp. FM7330 TaxID=3298610 RepID=UPI0036270085
MKNKTITCRTLEECIKKASEEFNIAEDKLNYEIIQQKNGLFIKRTTIEVKIEHKDNEEKEQSNQVQTQKDKIKKDEINGTAKVENGKLTIKNPKKGGRAAYIVPSKNVKVLVDNKQIFAKKEVNEESDIQIIMPENIAERKLNIEFSNNKMEAYITIKYKAQCIYALKDKEEKNTITLEEEVKQKINPPIYKKQEIQEELAKNDINYGIIEENVIKCTNAKGIDNMLVAKGVACVDDDDDSIEYKFQVDNQIKVDDEDRVDYKNIKKINTVIKGQVLAVRHLGKSGQDGNNVVGKVIKRKRGKKVAIKASDGCEIQEKNKVVALIDGKPSFRNSTFFVYPVHEVHGDVNLKSGNIDFVGEVIVHGNITEGMKVKAAGNVVIDGNVTNAEIFSKNNVTIKKNIILSSVAAGGKDVYLQKEIDYLDKITHSIVSLIDAVKQVKKFQNSRVLKDGEIIKMLVEKKYRDIPKLYFKLCGYKLNGEENIDDVTELINKKFIGLAPVNIQNVLELNKVVKFIEDKVESLKLKLKLPVDIDINYCQDSKIESSGSIYITGKGEYVSQITANDSVYFKGERTVARGGIIKAKNKVECSILGSYGGVSTKVYVEKDGHIWAKNAYQNTLFVVGTKEYVLDIASRDVHVYLDTAGELVVEKLKM